MTSVGNMEEHGEKHKNHANPQLLLLLAVVHMMEAEIFAREQEQRGQLSMFPFFSCHVTSTPPARRSAGGHPHLVLHVTLSGCYGCTTVRTFVLSKQTPARHGAWARRQER